MEKRYQIIGSGYASIDHLIKIDRPARNGFTSLISNSDHAESHYGGCSVNICRLLSRLGAPALPVMRVGADWKSSGYQDYLLNAGVPLDAVFEMPNRTTGSSYIIEDEDGKHITLFHPGAMDGRYARETDPILFQQSRYALMTVASREDNEIFYRQCREHRVPLILSMKLDAAAFPKSSLYDFLRCSSLIFTNENEQSEIVELFGLQSITDVFGLGDTEIIIVTLGSRGSRYFTKNGGSVEEGYVRVCPHEGKAVDYTGAGDAYVAGFLYGYIQGRPVNECCALGATCSSFIIEKMGCTTNAPDESGLLGRLEAWQGQNYE